MPDPESIGLKVEILLLSSLWADIPFEPLSNFDIIIYNIINCNYKTVCLKMFIIDILEDVRFVQIFTAILDGIRWRTGYIWSRRSDKG